MTENDPARAYSPDCLCCELLAHKWTPQIIAVLLAGPHRFSAIHAAIPTLSDKVLSRRLAELEKAGILLRTQYSEIPPRVEYALTPAGRALEPVIAEMDRWSREFSPDPATACGTARAPSLSSAADVELNSENPPLGDTGAARLQ